LFIEHIVSRQTAQALTLLNHFLEEGGEAHAFHRQVLELLRKTLLVKLGGRLTSYANLELGQADEEKLVALASQMTTARLQTMLVVWLEAWGVGGPTEIYQLPLELATVSMCEVPYEQPATATISPVSAPKTASAPTAPPAGEGALSLAIVAERWSEVVAKLRDYNHSLSFILSIAKPARLEGKTLTISFQYKLHQERVNDHKVRVVIEEALGQVLQQKLMIQPIVDEQATAPTGDLLSSVLTTFGGRVAD
jgi:DNA polymerase III gamma/tau subunit